MVSNSYILPLKAPSPLPANGVDIVTFKVWRNTLIAHIQQDVNHHYFMDGGIYSEWQAAEFGRRISQLHDDDPDKLALDEKYERIGQQVYNVKINNVLTVRNAQLSKFVTHIATLCHHTENDDVTNYSTSLQWIFDYLKKHYGLETRGANFMNLSDHVYKSGVPYQTFYKQYRASFLDNLRKRGDLVKYKNDYALPEDEKLSPSFENAIVLWALEKIDARLPSKVKKSYGHQMTGNVTLKDIQPTVFENIPLLLDELEQAQVTRSFSAQATIHETELNSIQYRGREKRRFNRQPGAGFRSRPQRGFSAPRPNVTRRQERNSTTSTKFCRICNLAGSDPQIFNSHEIGNCNRLTMRDLESLRDVLVLNGMATIDTDEPEEPEYTLQPGWDDEEANQIHHLNESD